MGTNNTWNGVIEELRLGRTDFSTLLTVVKERAEVMEYTTAVDKDEISIIMLALDGSKINWMAYH